MKLKWWIVCTCILFTHLLAAQPIANYPNRAIKFIVPFSPGSASDILARTISDKLQANLNQIVITENRPGAGGTIASSQVAKGPADGYNFIVVSAGHVVNPAIYKNLNYDTINDFHGVIPLASLPSVLVVAGNSTIKSVNDLLVQLKNNNKEMNYVSGGIGSASHMNTEKFLFYSQTKALHIPLKGANDMAIEIIAGRSQFGFMPLIAAQSFIKDGRLRALAVSSENRSSSLPNIPTMIELGQPGGTFNFWIGLLAPAKTPNEAIAKLHQEIQKIILSSEVKEKYSTIGAEPFLLSPEQFDQFIEKEYKSLGSIMSQSNVAN